MSWGVGDWVSNLFSSSPSAADTATARSFQDLGAGQFGPETAAQYQAAGGTIPSAGGAGGQNLAQALQGLGKMQLGGAAQQQQALRMPNVIQAQVGRPGSPVNLASLLSLLMQKQNQYFPGAANTQPVTMARPTGLLGM